VNLKNKQITFLQEISSKLGATLASRLFRVFSMNHCLTTVPSQWTNGQKQPKGFRS